MNKIIVGCGNGRDEGCGRMVECEEGFECKCPDCGRTLRKGKNTEPLEAFC